jgi:hypothetical protein
VLPAAAVVNARKLRSGRSPGKSNTLTRKQTGFFADSKCGLMRT